MSGHHRVDTADAVMPLVPADHRVEHSSHQALPRALWTSTTYTSRRRSRDEAFLGDCGEEAGRGSSDQAIYTGDMAAQGTGQYPIGGRQITSVLSVVRPETGARAMPICASTSIGFGDAQYAADLFAHQTRGNTYIRVDDPTSVGFEERLASREGGVGAVAPSLGQAAQRVGLLAFCQKGDQVAAQSLYRDRAVQAANLMSGVDETDGQLVSGWMR